MIRHIKRYFAIRSYARILPGELTRRFNVRDFYTLEQVTSAAEKAHLNMAFLAYAHATFCSSAEFDAYYGQLKLACDYESLRLVVLRRYFPSFANTFNAAAVIRAAKREDPNFQQDADVDDSQAS